MEQSSDGEVLGVDEKVVIDVLSAGVVVILLDYTTSRTRSHSVLLTWFNDNTRA